MLVSSVKQCSDRYLSRTLPNDMSIRLMANDQYNEKKINECMHITNGHTSQSKW